MEQGRFAYSDLVNHAFAFAALHPVGRTRKGTRVSYLTHTAHVALILARYDQDDETICAALLHDVVEDCELHGHTREQHARQIGEKFGEEVLQAVLDVTHQDRSADGRALTSAEKKIAYLEHLAVARERARWVSAADKLHNARSILSDLRREKDPAVVWSRFNVGPAETVRWYRDVYERLVEVRFRGEILPELLDAVQRMDSLAVPEGEAVRRARVHLGGE
jgi:(p)ppGpp synthase/HD superfamily hydrolase